MEVNTNLSTIGMSGPTAAKGPAAAGARNAPNRTDSATLNSLDETLQNLPATRSDAVERARGLVSDSSYPSQDVINQMSRFIAERLGSGE